MSLKTEFDEDRTRSILDPIHGLIRLTETEMKVVGHPLFQRLRGIRQNGLLQLVFPAATHTRFEHSLGVVYVAHGMLNSLWLNSRVGERKRTVGLLGACRAGDAVTFPKTGSEERGFITRITRLAALVHDLGHGPLSHTFDSFAPRRTAFESVLDAPELAALIPLRGTLIGWGKKAGKSADIAANQRVPHEVMSCVFFAKVWNALGEDDQTALAVCAAILGTGADDGGGSLAMRMTHGAWIPLIHDLVASAPADADRMDYLVRDSKAIGVSYGLFDRNRVLKSLLCYQEGEGADHRYRLGIKRSGVQAIENLMQARYELFAQVFFHKTNLAISLMLNEIAELANQELDLFEHGQDLDGMIHTYIDLSDESFVRLLRGKAKEWGTIPASITALAERIVDRRLWKRILEPTTKADAAGLLVKLKESLPHLGAHLRTDEARPSALKDLSRGAALLIRDDTGIYVAGKSVPWSTASSVIGALKTADEQSFRIYYTGESEAEAGEARALALKLVFESQRNTNASS